MIHYKKLLNGVEIPVIGLGTWQITDRALLSELMWQAIESGYQLFDIAAAYNNEISIGRVIRELSGGRKELFLSDKVWNTYRGYDKVCEACKKSLKKLKTDFLDLYLIHWPASMKLYDNWGEINADTWRGMEHLYKEGYVRAIGVCNFKVHHLEELKKTAQVLPMVNQFEFHPGMNQNELIDYCKKNSIIMEASSPLGNGKILENEILKTVAEEKNKTVAQICLRYALQKGFIVIPKTKTAERLKENMDIFNFSITKSETELLDSISWCGGLRIDSDEVTEFG